jgi:hypothetical protein
MSFNHGTYHVPLGTLRESRLEAFFTLLGFYEINPDDPHEHNWNVRWFKDAYSDGPLIHLVEGAAEIPQLDGTTIHTDRDYPGLGHFCVARPRKAYDLLARSPHCVRDSGSGRIWLQYANLRVEIRPL